MASRHAFFEKIKQTIVLMVCSACRQSHKKWLDRQAFFVKM
ncbi:hypothetical protein B4121_4463 [Bacillus paralicheniformis]|uniref:Uncharacterized protein n=1 Tax=Bacillus paralicheniformis TaxID=1648923 RepID=A0A7Z0WUX6_9BACI|nr:hypothetical protein B4121_4463 [Bacillus paralicheniformis]